MARKVLTTKLLQRLIAEEKARLLEKRAGELPAEGDCDDAKEIEAGEEADAVAHKVDFMKVLDIKEAKALKMLKKIREAKDLMKKQQAAEKSSKK